MLFLLNIFKYWKIAIIIGLSTIIGVEYWQLERKDNKIIELKVAIQEKVNYLESLENAVDVQNETINEMTKKTKEFKDKLDNANKKVVKIKEREREKIQSILQYKSGTSCEDNMNWLLNEAQKMKK